MIATRSSQYIGIGLLLFVNIVWVAASEITRYLFIDLDFKRPFFFTYAKSCMLVFFFIPYVCRCRKNSEESSSKKSGKSFYRRLKNEYDDDDESEKEEGSDDECFDKTLTEPDFELMDLESNTGGEHSTREGSQSSLVGENNQQQQQRRAKSRRVKFNKYREVRSIPEKLENAAKLARLPYRPNNGGDMMCLDCAGAQKSALFNYYVYFAPLWLIGSVSYQTALAYSSVSAVNLIAASSPLFVLILSALCGRYSPLDQFSWFKLTMVLLNFGGVCIVSKFSDSLIGSIISLFSAFSNALYLFALSRMSTREGNVDMPLMLGTVGIFSLLVCTPLMLMLHFTGLEPQLPFASFKQLGVLTINSFLGTIFADSLWLYATLKTGALTSALSGSLAIPLSILFDTYWRHQPLNTWQLLSSIPIMISFIGASYYTAIQTPTIQHRPLKNEEGGGHDDDECSTTATKATSTDGLEINSLHPPHNSNNASSTTSLQSQVSM